MASGPAVPFGNANNAGKKAVHVKWAGKTIALGTFPSSEADEKCARAKALTRAWRSTMRPKPNREWVMLELERLGVRVVSGRLGRKEGEKDGEGKDEKELTPEEMARRDSMLGARRDSMLGGRRDSITASLLSAADMARGGVGDRTNSLDWASVDPAEMMQRRSSSLALGLLGSDEQRRRESEKGAQGRMNSLSAAAGLGGSSNNPNMPLRRPMVGGGAAAAYEAAREDHYNSMGGDPPRRSSLGGLQGGLGGPSPQLGVSVSPNQHYEMLKLHHMNLLNEIQETTLMMNLYQQQQLQQQQQHLQQQHPGDVSQGGGGGQGGGGVGDMNFQMGNGSTSSLNLDSLYGPGGAGGFQGQRPSLGLGSFGPGGGGQDGMSNQMQAMMRQQNMMQGGGGGGGGYNMGDMDQQLRMNGMQGGGPQQSPADDSKLSLQEKLQRLKDDIAERERQAKELEEAAAASSSTSPGSKRKAEDTNGDNDGGNKRIKEDGAEERASESV